MIRSRPRSVTRIDREIRALMGRLRGAREEAREDILQQISALKRERFDMTRTKTFDRMLTSLA